MLFNVVLVCDHKWRDLPGLVWLAHLLKQKRPSWHITVISQTSLFGYAKIFRPTVLIIPASARHWLEHADHFSRQGALTIILPTEGLPIYGNLAEYFLTSYSGHQADCILLWSEAMLQVFKRCKPTVAKRASVAGSTRFDFYQKPLNDLLLTKNAFTKQNNIPAGRPIVSWVTNFASARFYRNNEEWQIEDWLNSDYSKMGFDRTSMKVFIKKSFTDRNISWSCLKQCAQALPDVSFCLKPHPFEDYNWCETSLKEWQAGGIRNVFLIRGVFIWDLLNSCSVHVHRECTTALEAWLLAKPTIELRFIKSYSDFVGREERLSGVVRDAEAAESLAASPEEVTIKLKEYLKRREVPEGLIAKRQECIHRWLYKTDGQAAKRAVDQICAWVDEFKPAKQAFFKKHALRARLAMRIKEVLGFPFDESFRNPGIPIKSMFDPIGHWDRVICQRDILHWQKKLRKF